MRKKSSGYALTEYLYLNGSDEIQRVQKEEKQTEKRIKNIIFNNKKKKINAILTVNKLHFYFYFCGYLRG